MSAILLAVGPVLRTVGQNWQLFLIGALLLWGGLERMGRLSCVEGRAKAIVEAQKKADLVSAELLAEREKKQQVIETKVTEYVDKIREIKIPQECPADPRSKLGTDGVRDILGFPKAKR